MNIPQSVEELQIYILAAAVAMARTTAMIIVMPAFSRLGLTGILQGGVALCLSLTMLPVIAPTMMNETLTVGMMIAILAKETLVGFVIGVVLGIPIWAAEAAGDILDMQRAATFAEISDPSYLSQVGVSGTLFAIIMVAIFYASGGLAVTLRIFYDSYAIWPVQDILPVFNAETKTLFVDFLDQIVGLGLMLIVPISIALLLSDFALAIVARAAPQMNIFALSLAVKNLIAALLLVLYGAFMLSYMQDNMRWFTDVPALLERIAP